MDTSKAAQKAGKELRERQENQASQIEDERMNVTEGINGYI